MLAFLLQNVPLPVAVGERARFFTYFGLELRMKCTRSQAAAGLNESGHELIGGAKMPGDTNAVDVGAAVATFHGTLGKIIWHQLVARRARTHDN